MYNDLYNVILKLSHMCVCVRVVDREVVEMWIEGRM